MTRSTLYISLALLALVASACRSPQYVAKREMPAAGPDAPAQMPGLQRYDGYTAPEDLSIPPDSSTAPVATFCEEIATSVQGRKSVGCLPLVLADPRAQAPWVPLYGVDLADQVAGTLRARGFATTVLTTTEMGARIVEALGDKVTLPTLESVRRHAAALDVELAVFGSLRRDNAGARDGRDVLTVDLQCYDFVTSKLVSRTTFEVPTDNPANARIWHLVQRKSAWSPSPE